MLGPFRGLQACLTTFPLFFAWCVAIGTMSFVYSVSVRPCPQLSHLPSLNWHLWYASHSAAEHQHQPIVATRHCAPALGLLMGNVTTTLDTPILLVIAGDCDLLCSRFSDKLYVVQSTLYGDNITFFWKIIGHPPYSADSSRLSPFLPLFDCSRHRVLCAAVSALPSDLNLAVHCHSDEYLSPQASQSHCKHICY
jgi:hypothetical protein